MFPRLRPIDHLLLVVLFGGIFAYFIYGAISGHLYIPGKRGPGVVLSGWPAWLFVMSPPMLYSAILVRHQFFLPRLTPRSRTALELTLLFSGVGVLFLAVRLHWESFCAL